MGLWLGSSAGFGGYAPVQPVRVVVFLSDAGTQLPVGCAYVSVSLLDAATRIGPRPPWDRSPHGYSMRPGSRFVFQSDSLGVARLRDHAGPVSWVEVRRDGYSSMDTIVSTPTPGHDTLRLALVPVNPSRIPSCADLSIYKMGPCVVEDPDTVGWFLHE